MYWKKQPIIDTSILLDILNQNINNYPKHEILRRCQLITNNNYCNYIHRSGKNKGFICGTISKNKNGRCYTHSRNKSKFNNEIQIKKEKNNQNPKIIIEINIYLIILFFVL